MLVRWQSWLIVNMIHWIREFLRNHAVRQQSQITTLPKNTNKTSSDQRHQFNRSQFLNSKLQDASKQTLLSIIYDFFYWGTSSCWWFWGYFDINIRVNFPQSNQNFVDNPCYGKTKYSQFLCWFHYRGSSLMEVHFFPVGMKNANESSSQSQSH